MLTTELISHLFLGFNDKKIIIIGDVMIDSYLWGSVDRISPEAPVPIVAVEKRENRLGGAANVGLNIKSLGATPYLCSVIGNDLKGNEYIQLMNECDLPLDGIIQSNKRITTTKFRVIGNNTQMLRVDEEINTNLEKDEQSQLLNKITELINDKNIDAIIFQDYDKGVIDERLISSVVEIANKKEIPVVVDPKKRNFLSYKNVSMFKPNLKEIKEGLNINFDVSNREETENAVSKLQEVLNAKIVLNTLSEYGIFVRWKEENEFKSEIIGAHLRNIADVSGAGDTVISVASLCLASNTNITNMAAISNLAGGLVCEEVGVVPIDKNKLQDEVNRLLSK
jgi:rfaE bifunctional protein kinase chain/domain